MSSVASGKTKRTSITTRTSGVVAEVESLPKDRSLADWKALSRESLVLQCNAVNIRATGSPTALAQRLYNHFQQLVVTSAAFTVTHSTPATPAALPSPQPLPSNFQDILRSEFRRFLSEQTLSSSDIAATLNPSSPTVDLSAAPPATGNIIHNGTVFPGQDVAGQSVINNVPVLSLSSPFPGAATLPPLPQSLLLNIRRGEFINFDQLLPSVSPLAIDEYSIEVHSNSVNASGPSVSLVPKRQHQPKAKDFHSWLTAWNIYLQAMIVYHPHLVSQLIHYQATITRFVTQYSFTAVLTYDRLFRYSIANKQLARWDVVDDNLFNLYLRGAPPATTTARGSCYTCHGVGHFSSTCPQRGSTSIASATTTSGQPPFRAPQPPPPPFHGTQHQHRHSTTAAATPWEQRVCFFYNKRGRCDKQTCQFMHRCQLCTGPHAAVACPRKPG